VNVTGQYRWPLDYNVGTRPRRRLATAATLLIAIAGSGLIAACGRAAPAGTAATSATGETGTTARLASSPSGTIHEDGSSLLLPLMNVWKTRYQQQFPGVTVKTAAGGSPRGITDATATKGGVDIGASDAYLSAGDLLNTPGLLNIPLAVSAQSVIFHLPAGGS
jgi:phosphate transport system substrate-binding protein